MSNFDKLYHHSIDRFNYGGVQASDYVKIKKTDVEGSGDGYKEALKDFASTDLNLKVLEIVNTGVGKDQPKVYSAVIGQEMAGGLFPKKITVPVGNLEVLSYNVPPSIPDSWKVANKSDFNGEPEFLNKDEKSEVHLSGQKT
jgi:hypothetical protein